ncbi:MAG: GNAT family protein [Vulcanimicrobiaceae bacterium]
MAPNNPAIALTDFHLRVNEETELRPVRLADTEELYRLVHQNYGHLYPWMGWVPEDGVTREGIRDFLRSKEKAAREQTQYHAAIVLDGRIIGSIGLSVIDWQNRIAHVGYWLSEEWTGRGIMTASVSSLVGYAFDALEFNRIEIRCEAENDKSAAVPRRLGFRHEGTLREAQLIHGRYRDDCIFAMLARDWQNRTPYVRS